MYAPAPAPTSSSITLYPASFGSFSFLNVSMLGCSNARGFEMLRDVTTASFGLVFDGSTSSESW
ncbi:hypothetical protein D3C85_1807410 [compost metagenome]